MNTDLNQPPWPHGIIASDGVQAVCACGTLLSVYGSTRTLLAALAQHVAEARQQEAGE